ncbi:MAG TPA: hypothetical protein VHO06_22735 [Polyangia bacterium]|nr:hypothetical protein [Polyangia bacterium]
MFHLGTLLLSLLIAATANSAAAGERVLVVDDVSLTPGLEKANARPKMLDAVTATVTQHGWQPVVSATCHDFTCVGPGAAASSANYALILTAWLKPSDDGVVATDLQAALWHDGAVIARWTEEDEKAEAEKTPGGFFISCAPPNGLCTAPLLTSKFQQASARLLEAESAAIQKRVAAVALTVKPPVAAAPSAVPPAAQSSGVGGIVGWSVVGVGVAALATGISFWALDGHPTGNCAGVCVVYDTRTPGIVLTTLGAAGVVAGGLLVWRAESNRRPQVAVGLGSLLLRGRF